MCCSGGLQRAIAFECTRSSFAPLVIATAILALDRRHWPLFWTMAIRADRREEDLSSRWSSSRIYLFIRGERRQGCGAGVGGFVAFLLVVGVCSAVVNPAGAYGFAEPYRGVIERPWTIR